MHAPHHVAKEWADRYAGQFDDGWDAYRERGFARQKELGIMPATAAQVLDCLEGLLGPLAARNATAGQVADADGVIRVMLNLPHWDDFARSCLDDIIAASADSPMVLVRTRDLLTRLSRTAPSSGQKVLASRLRWVEDTLARDFPVVWADTASARDGRPTPDPPWVPGRLS